MEHITRRARITKTWRVAYACFALAVLLVPAAAMQVSKGVNWGAEDFVAAAGLLGIAWAAVEVLFRVVERRPARVIGTSLAVIGVLAVWAQLAVGII